VYTHLDSVRVKAGQEVRRGETVGSVGSTGRSTGPHLHFEVIRGGQAVDPEAFVRFPEGRSVSAGAE
jgi:murein DD-endopeptidase MepM/ murein hydrolase activator NlpD